MSDDAKAGLPSHPGSANWWDATATENVISACLQQIESLRGKLPMGVALSLQRAHTALKESLVNARSLKTKSPHSGPTNPPRSPTSQPQ